MKIVRVSNFDDDTYAQEAVAENIGNEREAKIMLDALCATCTSDGYDYYRLFPDEHVLWRGMADLVGE